MPGAAVRLLALDTTVVVDSATLAVTGRASLSLASPVTGRVIALADNLQSAPFVVTVLRAPDSLAAVGATRDTVPATDSVSAPLSAELFDLRTDGTPHGLNWGAIGDTVRFEIVFPVFADTASTTASFGRDSLAVAAVTSTITPGVATVFVHRRRSPQPDSVVVQASAHRASGAAVPGSPVRFVVVFP